jgi:hypothetical protein
VVFEGEMKIFDPRITGVTAGSCGIFASAENGRVRRERGENFEF